MGIVLILLVICRARTAASAAPPRPAAMGLAVRKAMQLACRGSAGRAVPASPPAGCG